ncbi:DUF6621 family protein [Hoylesella saccharolytica]|uniref:DUF6621 family protein n=1 Tax=Hoylesella saccharolytica TaxID=633701 RepID=UPI00047061A0|nr:DUF6621 family protein [Hoylesella saccharolytica]
MENQSAVSNWSENIIVVDADYIDNVAFNLIVNFERIIGRRIPQADMARWLDCIALDGGLREGGNTLQVVFIHAKDKQKMENFSSSNYAEELDGKAFKDHLGEFVLNALPVEELVNGVDFFLDVVQTVCAQPAVKRVMIIPNAENAELYDALRRQLHYVDDDGKRITVFTMQPMSGGNFRQEILGYSLMNALGIKADEIPR